MMLWIKDPTTGQPSVSLSLLILSVVLMVVFIGLEAFEVMKSSSLLDEFFLTSVGLYFGRRVNYRTGDVGATANPTPSPIPPATPPAQPAITP